jgi:hypothetical protein
MARRGSVDVAEGPIAPVISRGLAVDRLTAGATMASDWSPQNCNQTEQTDQHKQGGNRHGNRAHGIVGKIRPR